MDKCQQGGPSGPSIKRVLVVLVVLLGGAAGAIGLAVMSDARGALEGAAPGWTPEAAQELRSNLKEKVALDGETQAAVASALLDCAVRELTQRPFDELSAHMIEVWEGCAGLSLNALGDGALGACRETMVPTGVLLAGASLLASQKTCQCVLEKDDPSARLATRQRVRKECTKTLFEGPPTTAAVAAWPDGTVDALHASCLQSVSEAPETVQKAFCACVRVEAPTVFEAAAFTDKAETVLNDASLRQQCESQSLPETAADHGLEACLEQYASLRPQQASSYCECLIALAEEEPTAARRTQLRQCMGALGS